MAITAKKVAEEPKPPPYKVVLELDQDEAEALCALSGSTNGMTFVQAGSRKTRDLPGAPELGELLYNALYDAGVPYKG